MFLGQNPLRNILLQLVAGWPTFDDKMPGLFLPLFSKLKLLQVQEREGDVTSALVASTRRFDWHAIGASSLYVHLTVFNKCCATIASRSNHKIFHALFGYLVSE